MTANVRRIEQIDLNYAKTAKRINVVKLKSDIWSTLKESIKAMDIAAVHEKKFPNLHKVVEGSTSLFSDLLLSVDSKMTDDASKDLSVAVLMTCLLLLSNETVIFVLSELLIIF